MIIEKNHINNYYLLYRLAGRLNEILPGQVLEQCFSLNKKEIFFSFSDFGIKGYFAEQCFLFSHDNIYKPNPKHQACFDDITGKQVLACKVHVHDRSMRIVFDGGYNLVFMMYGRNGNIILCKINDTVDLFREQFEKHRSIKLSDFSNTKAPVYEEFELLSRENGAIAATKQLFKGMAKDMLKYVEAQNIETLQTPEQWQRIKAFESILTQGTIDVCEKQENESKSVYLTLLPSDTDKVLESTTDVIVAIDSYARNYYFTNYFSELKNSRIAKLTIKSEKTNQQLKAAQQHLVHLENESSYKKQADIIMANLHQIPHGAETVTLFDFYTGQDVDLAMKRGLSPQLWAEKLYRKAKNQVIEKQKTLDKISNLETEWLNLSDEIDKIKAIEDIRDLKVIEKTEKKNPEKELSPFRHFNFEGYDIYVGKNAANNDKLTFGFAHKEDMWLHAQGVSGSHVIIKHKQKSIFPEPVITKAARLAAFNSKSKGSIMVPVIYTLRKFVRKPKGAAPGSVICEKEKMVMVEPGVV